MTALERPETLDGYLELRRWLRSLRHAGRMSDWGDAVRWYIEEDLFYLVNDVLLSTSRTRNSETGEPLFFHEFYLDWCRDIEWQVANGGGLDASARRSGKSTLRTLASNIQRMVKYPDSSACLFSFQRKAARKHIRGMMTELEQNVILRTVCDDVFFWDPGQSAKNRETTWSQDDGLLVKRKRISPNLSMEFNAFMDGTPTGGGFDRIDFDDIEDHKAVGTTEMMDKLHRTYDSTVNLATPNVLPQPVLMFTNTFYSDLGLAKRVHDAWEEIDPRKVRKVAGEDLTRPGDGPMGGTPGYPFTAERLQRVYNEMRDKREYAIQVCCSFLAGEQRRLNPDWLQRYDETPEERGKNKNIYICIDPSTGKQDPMAIIVWALGADRSVSLVDASLKRLDPALPDFYDEIFMLVSKWANIGRRVVEIRVEGFGQSMYDAAIKNDLQFRGFYRTRVVNCADNMRSYKFDSGKRDREFERLAKPAADGQVFIPRPTNEGGRGLIRQDENGERRDLVKHFVEREWKLFPKPLSDDMLDAASLLWEPEAKVGALQWPTRFGGRKAFRSPFTTRVRGATPMSAG